MTQRTFDLGRHARAQIEKAREVVHYAMPATVGLAEGLEALEGSEYERANPEKVGAVREAHDDELDRLLGHATDAMMDADADLAEAPAAAVAREREGDPGLVYDDEPPDAEDDFDEDGGHDGTGCEECGEPVAGDWASVCDPCAGRREREERG